MKKYINPANILTSTRLLVLPLMVWALANHQYFLGSMIVAYSGVVDLFDGKVARYFNCATKFGEMLDAISDASLFFVTLITAAIYGYADPLVVILFLAAGVLNASGRVIHIKLTGKISNFRSYASEVIGGVTFFTLASISLDYYVDPTLWILTITTFIVAIHDLHRIITLPSEVTNG
jgi:phosphatidylglycerophosphate synthase